MIKAGFTGSFDPVTNGHIEIVKRALTVFDEVVVMLLVNPQKEYAFSKAERLDMLKLAFGGMKNVSVASSDGYAVDLCKEQGVSVMVRGVRNDADFEYEKNLAKQNYDYGKIETVFFFSSEEAEKISSTEVRERIAKNEKIKDVPQPVAEYIEKIKKEH